MMQTFNKNPDGKVHIHFDASAVDALLSLQLASADPEVTTFCSVVSNLADFPTGKSFLQALLDYPKLNKVYNLAKFNFAEVADPIRRSWRPPSKHDIVQELFLNLPSISSVYSTKDGQRYCVFNGIGEDRASVIMTFMEYEVNFNGTVQQKLRPTLKKKIENLHKVKSFIDAPAPTMYRLSVGSHDQLEVDAIDLLAYTEDGVKSYALRNRLHILDIEESPTVFEDGHFRGRS